MQFKTKKELLLSLLELAGGAGLIALGFSFIGPAIQLAGFALAVFGTIGLVDGIGRGIKDIVEFRRFQKSRHSQTNTIKLENINTKQNINTTQQQDNQQEFPQQNNIQDTQQQNETVNKKLYSSKAQLKQNEIQSKTENIINL